MTDYNNPTPLSAFSKEIMQLSKPAGKKNINEHFYNADVMNLQPLGLSSLSPAVPTAAHFADRHAFDTTSAQRKSDLHDEIFKVRN